jgi:hypothetical protein
LNRRIDASLPYIKSIGTSALTEAVGEEGDLETIAGKVRAFYRDEHSEVFESRQSDIESAITEIQTGYSRNNFPKMDVTWGTYPNNIGHKNFPGCFRCHDESHETETGEVISQDCATCHAVLAWEEENPEVLEQLGIEW